jgi:subtilisin family serine protease
MNVTTRPEHLLSKAARASQRREVSTTRAALLGELARKPQNLKTANDMPLIAFTATARDLRRLQKSPRVAVVTEDQEYRLRVPSSGVSHADSGTPGTAPQAVVSPEASVTSSNGSTNQLRFWWDYYRIGVDIARENGWNGKGKTVAIIDSGVARKHPWIFPRVVYEACFTRRATCPNGRTSMVGLGAAAPCTFTHNCAHGTHVAHTAAGKHGVASAARILAVRVFYRAPNGSMTTSASDLVWSLRQVYVARTRFHIAAVNMSLGFGMYRGFCDNAPSDGTVNRTYLTGWIRQLRGVGIATVVSSGNGNAANGMEQPACISYATSVGNTTRTPAGADAVYGNVAGGSNANPTLDLLAPGTDICSAVPLIFNRRGAECDWTGTSMAAPHVTGAMAVLRQRRPAATVLQMEQALKAGGVPVTDSRNGIVRPRIDIWRSLGLI